MKKKGVIDRIEDQKLAVILLENEGIEFVVEKERLPEEAKEGTWLFISVENEEITHMTIDESKTNQTLLDAQTKLDRIRDKSKGSKFKR